MDTENLIKEAKARFSHNSAKQYLKDKYSSKLSVAEQGGLWLVTPELLGFLASLEQDQVIIVDSFENPVKVNRMELLIKLLSTYNTVMLQWYNEHKELENKR
jgi:hypothetical protein